ncbi:hypothetical protein CFC21_051309 [Triticum aestivum]|uniref:Cystatin domain-containing protein n=2 Tax=Triticum aestivum TaxID=4565 RepID=A0A9R1G7D0_WHEAT|nr:putative cysteine proteinase inhibitor 7 [Triticum dicoccoides]XP_044362525.1 putative cysteine proteinase inhibitor 7 [Triticum aestivum]KAF7041524.1 hypothetical protein CFC21_051308 [Triticum aestivum]KAF7041525.1 hypothetical protein CFC21_051309 [Triticum aestivum]
MRTSIALVIVVAAIIYAVAMPATAMPGGWEHIGNINDPKIQGLGRWAVAEHVKQAGGRLRFIKVVLGTVQVVSGFNYRLVVEALNGAGKKDAYKVEVYEAAANKRRKLISFAPVAQEA